MKLAEALQYLERGHTIRRASWIFDKVVEPADVEYFHVDGLLADDWEIVKMQFHEALNLMLTEHRSMYRFGIGDGKTNAILFDGGKLYMGLGTCGAHEYQFTDTDRTARDWVVKGT